MGDHPYALAKALTTAGKRRGFVITETPNGVSDADGHGAVIASDPCLEPLAAFLRDGAACPDYLGHEGLFFEVGSRTNGE